MKKRKAKPCGICAARRARLAERRRCVAIAEGQVARWAGHFNSAEDSSKAVLAAIRSGR